MTAILVDTSAYSSFMKGSEAAVEAIRRADTLVLTPVVLGELKAGFLRSARRKENEEEIEEVLRSRRSRTVQIDEETADRYAVIHADLRRAGRPVPTNDLWIAASAMQHGLRVLTADAHFLKIPQILVDFLEQPS
ncbi:MAG: type II toxin-antitoxin system VapC family toxin [Gemmatimonadota bacterium]